MDTVFQYTIKTSKYRFRLPYSLIVLFFLFFESLNAQNFLEFSKESCCLYHGDSLPEELYRYSTESDTFQTVKDEILNKTNSENNFELIWSNVPSIVAINDSGKRYILYSRRYIRPFLKQTDDKILAVAILAHAIGHHANNHRLIGITHDEEEIEADEFMGYALSLLGFALEQVESIPSRIRQTNGLNEEDRLKAILRGYQRADASLRNGVHASYFENNINEVIRSFPKFELPPPQWSADADLDSYFEHCHTLYDAERIVRQAMDATGYYSRKYFRVNDGFAMVTRLEQFNPDGSCKNEADRWKSKPVGSESFSIMDYLYSLFIPEPGYFRVIVFVVTPETFNGNVSKTISREEATGWLNEGRNRLPDAIGDQAFIPGKTAVTALIYEFIAKESDNKLTFHNFSNIEGITHLRKSGMLDKFPRP
jgi:hypothetical protein